MMKKCASCGREFQDQTTFCPFDGKKLESAENDADKFLGTVLDGKYFIESRIGQGGMGNVYKSKHVHMETAVAVKILHPHLVSDQTTVERFRREARAAVAVNHPNAIHVMDFGVTGDKTVYLVMEFLEGVSLRKILETERPMAADKTIEIMKQTCAAVDAAHTKNIIHRDLKPDNIVILNHGTGNDTVKVLDFSIAKLRAQSDGPVNLTQQGMVVGTPQYMSPEQAEGQELDARSDIYSLGVILYEMLTGDLPFKATTPMALILKHIHALPRPLREIKDNISPALEAVVLRTLAKKREDRPQTALELAAELEEALRQSSGVAISMSEPVSMAKPAEVASSPSPSGANPLQKPIAPVSITSQPTVISPPPPNTSGALNSNPATNSNSNSISEYSGDWSEPSFRANAPKFASAPSASVGTAPVIDRSVPPEVKPQVQVQTPQVETKKRLNPLVFVAGGVLVALIFAVIAYFAFLNKPEPETAKKPTPAQWLERYNLVNIPNGTLQMGRPFGTPDVDDDAMPEHPVQVANFFLGKYEVTNKQYQEFINKTNHPSPQGWTGTSFPPGTDDFPVSNISWNDAIAFCDWLSKESGMTFRLPSEAEWEYAARGTDGRIYPWGPNWNSANTVSNDNGGAPVSVRSPLLGSDVSPFGIIGLAGNVSEWTSSIYYLYPGSKAKLDADCKDCKIIRGGNYKSTSRTCTVTRRVYQQNTFSPGMERVGFRLAANPPPPEQPGK